MTAIPGTNDFFDCDLELPEEVIEGILREGQLWVLAGSPNVGKSPLLADTTVRLVRGLDWLVRRVSERPVITFDLESNGKVYRHNIRNCAKRFQVASPAVPDEVEPYLELDDPQENPYTDALMKALASDNSASILNLIEQGLERKPNAVVIMDPADLLFRFDTKSNRHIIWLYSRLRALLAKYPRAAMILVLNLRKADRQLKRPNLLTEPRTWLEEVSGHMDLINRSDVRLGMDFHTDDVRVINGIRRGEPVEPILVREFALADEELAGFEPVAIDHIGLSDALSPTQLSHYRQLPKTFTFEEGALIVPRSSLSRLLKRCKSLGAIEQVENLYRKLVEL